MDSVMAQFCPNARPGNLPLCTFNPLSGALLSVLGFWKMKCLYDTFWMWECPDKRPAGGWPMSDNVPHPPMSNGMKADTVFQCSSWVVCGSHWSGRGWCVGPGSALIRIPRRNVRNRLPSLVTLLIYLFPTLWFRPSSYFLSIVHALLPVTSLST